VGKNESEWDVVARRIYKAKFMRMSNRIEIIIGYVLMSLNAV